jgi:hypothetical protein
VRRWEWDDDGKNRFMCSKSINDERVGLDSNYVRCEIVFQSISIKELENRNTQVKFLSCINPNGFLKHFQSYTQKSSIISLFNDLPKGCALTLKNSLLHSFDETN